MWTPLRVSFAWNLALGCKKDGGEISIVKVEAVSNDVLKIANWKLLLTMIVKVFKQMIEIVV